MFDFLSQMTGFKSFLLFPRCQGITWQREEMGCVSTPEERRETCFLLLGLFMSFTRVKYSTECRMSLRIGRHDVSQRPVKPLVIAVFRAYFFRAH